MTLAERLSNQTLRLLAAIAAIAIGVAIAWLSLEPPGTTPAPRFSDKIQHLIAYLVLAIPVAIAAGRGRLLLGLAICVAVGASLEGLQATMAVGREGSVADGLANAIGASLGTGLVAFLMKARR